MTETTDLVPTAPVVAEEPEERGGGDRRRTVLAVLAALVVAGLLAGLIVLVAAEGGDDGPGEVRVTIPAGTGERVAAGDRAGVLRSVLRIETGQELVVQNDDARLHVLGPITVPPGETARQTFPTEGRFPGTTSVRGDGRLTILVETR